MLTTAPLEPDTSMRTNAAPGLDSPSGAPGPTAKFCIVTRGASAPRCSEILSAASTSSAPSDRPTAMPMKGAANHQTFISGRPLAW